jgi:radical SAM protein with 4Fe4S-binding SPASM domain
LHSLSINLTYRCQFKCAYCEIRHVERSFRKGEGRPMGPELDSARIKGILSEAKTLGLGTVNLTGGEPFIRRDIYEIIDHAARIGLILGINTRHTFGDDDAARIRAAGNVRLWVSIDSHDVALSERMSGRPSYFVGFIDGVRRLTAAGVPVAVTSVISKLNFPHLRQLFEFLAELKVDRVHTREVSVEPACVDDYSRGDVNERRALQLSADEQVEFRRLEPEFAGRLRFSHGPQMEGDIPSSGGDPSVIGPTGAEVSATAPSAPGRPLVLFAESEARDSDPEVDWIRDMVFGAARRTPLLPMSRCNTPNGAIDVAPDGKIFYCNMAHDYVIGDLARESLHDFLSGGQLEALCRPEREAFRGTRCFDCDFFVHCNAAGRCYVNNLRRTGVTHVPDPNLCSRYLGKTRDKKRTVAKAESPIPDLVPGDH